VEQSTLELQVGESVTRVATAKGGGLITYASSDTWVAEVDGAGVVTAKKPGAVTITATKAADDRYLAATANYSLTVSSGTYLNAWIGSSDTLLNFPAFAKGAELYRSSSSTCDFSSYTSCPDSSLTVIQNASVNDNAHLEGPGYYLLKSDRGVANVSVNLNSRFTSRFSPAAVSFKGRLWIIGGVSNFNYDNKPELKNDIWSSADGINWKLETPAAAFSPRSSHKVLEHNGKLYLFGGTIGIGNGDFGADLSANEIWSSSDGINWVLETDRTLFSFKWGNPFVCVSFNNKMWVIMDSVPGKRSNEVWSSVDGKNWTLELASEAFSPRVGHKLVSFQNRLWLFAGEYGHEIWSSIDGINWIKEADTTGFFITLDLLTPIVQNNKLWLLGGDSQFTYFSEDGVKWTHAPAEASYGDRSGAQFLTFENQIWLIGGGDEKRSLREVLVSADAHKWELKTTDAVFPRRYSHKVIVHNGNVFLIGGILRPGYLKRNDVWSSANGINWDIRTASAAFAPRITEKIASFNNKIWLMGEDLPGGYPDDVWSSEDGVTWLKHSDNLWKLTEPTAYTHQLFTFNNELWLLGSVERTLNRVRIPALWSSKDGVSWRLRTSTSVGSADVPGFSADNRGQQVVVFKNKLWLIYPGQAWSSADGIIWKKDDTSGAIWGHTGYQLTVFKDKIWMIGGADFIQGGFTAADIWSTSDGVNWKQEASSVNFPRGRQVVTFNDQILLIGGKSELFSIEDGVGGEDNEIWASTDGIEWRRGYQTPLKFTQ